MPSHEFTETRADDETTQPDFLSVAITGRRITGEPGQNAVLDGRCPVDPRGCAALRAVQPADRNPPPRCRGREASATTLSISGDAQRRPLHAVVRRRSHHEGISPARVALHSNTEALISIVIVKKYSVPNSDGTVLVKKCRLRIRHPWRVTVLIA